MISFDERRIEIGEEADQLVIRSLSLPMTRAKRLLLVSAFALAFFTCWVLSRSLWSSQFEDGIMAVDPLFWVIGPILTLLVLWDLYNVGRFHHEFRFRESGYELRASDHFHHEGVGYGGDFAPVRVIVTKSVPFLRADVWLLNSRGERLKVSRWATLEDRRIVGNCLSDFYKIPLVDETRMSSDPDEQPGDCSCL